MAERIYKALMVVRTHRRSRTVREAEHTHTHTHIDTVYLDVPFSSVVRVVVVVVFLDSHVREVYVRVVHVSAVVRVLRIAESREAVCIPKTRKWNENRGM